MDMRRILRVIAGLLITGVVLWAADLATRDCRIVLYVYDNCMWLRLQNHLGLPNSPLLRMLAMEFAGIALAVILYVTCRYVFPRRAAHTTSEHPEN